MLHDTFSRPSLSAFARLDELGLVLDGQRVTPERAVLDCHVAQSDEWCHRCGCWGGVRDTVVRRLSHVPWGWRPTILEIRLRRYRCTGCHRVWRQDCSKAAEPRSKLSRAALRYGLEGLVVEHLTVARVAENLAVSWDTANDAILAEGRRRLISDPTRFDGVHVIGVDEHVWRHTKKGDRFVTVIIDLTPVADRVGPARLLDMVEGRSKQVFKTWLAERPKEWKDGIQIVAMDGFTGFKTAAVEEVPQAVEIMDPFHAVALLGEKVDTCRQRVQQETCGHRGRKGDPLYGVRLTLHTDASMLTDKQRTRLEAVFADQRHAQVEVTWSIYQMALGAYRNPDKQAGRRVLSTLIETINHAVPAALTEVISVARTLKRRREDLLAYFDHPHTSNGPTEAINGRLEHLRGSALGFRNLTNYIARSLLETGGFRPHLHPQMG